MNRGKGSVSSAKLALIVAGKVLRSLGEADLGGWGYMWSRLREAPTLIQATFTRSIRSKGLINGYSQPLSLISGEDGGKSDSYVISHDFVPEVTSHFVSTFRAENKKKHTFLAEALAA